MLEEERQKLRFTLSDLVDRLQKQTNYFKESDWYSVPFVTPISELVSSLQDDPKISFTSHPACGLATYFFVDKDRNIIPISRFLDVVGLMKDFFELSKKARDSRVKFVSKIKALGILKKHFDNEKAPKGLTFLEFARAVERILGTGDKKGVSDFSWQMMYVGGMHFQDNYNYDIERVKRCVIHYVVPDGRMIPFCAYNSGPTFRESVEKKFSMSLAEWRRMHGDEYT